MQIKYTNFVLLLLNVFIGNYKLFLFRGYVTWILLPNSQLSNQCFKLIYRPIFAEKTRHVCIKCLFNLEILVVIIQIDTGVDQLIIFDRKKKKKNKPECFYKKKYRQSPIFEHCSTHWHALVMRVSRRRPANKIRVCTRSKTPLISSVAKKNKKTRNYVGSMILF